MVMNDSNKTGIFLTGGGGIGAFHIGFFKALEECKINYDFVFGSSVGAIIAGAATYLHSDEMYERWKTLTLESVLKIDNNRIKDLEGMKRTLMLYRECIRSCSKKDPNLMIDINDIRNLLYASLDGNNILNSEIGFGISTTLLPSMRQLNICKEDMVVNPLEYILASLYLPIFSRQRIIDDRHYIDLSRFRRYPLEVLKDRNCKNIFIVNIESNNLNKFYRAIDRDFADENVVFINYDNKPSILDFSLEQAEKNYRNGYESSIKVLEKSIGKN